MKSNTSSSHLIRFILMAITCLFGPAMAKAGDVYNIPAGNAEALRAAVIAANADPDEDTINLAPNSGYTFLTPYVTYLGSIYAFPTIEAPLIINGNWAVIQRWTNSETPAFAAFRVRGTRLTLNQMSLRHFRSDGAYAGCLAIVSVADTDNITAELNLNGVYVETCHGHFFSPGAIYGSGVSGHTYRVNINNCFFWSNTSDAGAGALHFDGDGSNPQIHIANTSFWNNHGGNTGALQMYRCFEGSLTNCTISGNSSQSYGGAIYARRSDVDVTSCTITDNTAPYGGAGVTINESSGMRLSHCIIAGNHSALDPTQSDLLRVTAGGGGNFRTLGHNVLGFFFWQDITCYTGATSTCATDHINIADPRLSPMAYNGGVGFTHALLCDSPALDGGNPLAAPTSFDERGTSRPRDGDGNGSAISDIGALESTAVFDFSDSDGDGSQNCVDGCPNDPNKSSPGTCGCGTPDVDTDGDGTMDCLDDCPNDSAKTTPGDCGCGVADTDSDGDGTPNCFDDCPNDPFKTEPGICGCGIADNTLDIDGDGTPNCVDGCPYNPNKTAPGACGCYVPDTDSDGDGTPDCSDQCPFNPLKTLIGACGCDRPDTDTDGDGRADCIDGCPNDPNKTHPGACGCGTSDVNSDGDSRPDCTDGCPFDRFKIAPGACGCGVPDTDSDSDGTPNCNDGCPNDPSKIAPGTCGCGTPDTDSDSDGTPNCNDGCPNDPNKIAPGTCGCGTPDTDSDGDGIPNCNDACPNDPNKIAPGTCGCGIPDTDSDGDGTPNCNDGCPNDPNKLAPGTCGCGTPDTDSDSDGTPNCNDGCPNDPNKIAPGTCGCGIPDTDSDGDGTPNCNDGCPNDPNKIAPGACGCGTPDTDSDGDGIPNCNDGCPNDPNKIAPGSCGCGIPDTDSDSDGTPNCNDGCPNDPNKTSAGACGCGVAETDSDGDGISDCVDLCQLGDDHVDCNGNGIPDACDAAEPPGLHAVAFDGVDDGISCGQVLVSPQFTIEAWVKPTSLTGIRRIVSNRGCPYGISLALIDGRLLLSGFGAFDLSTSASYMTTSTWQHIAVTFDAANDARFFVNGRLVETRLWVGGFVPGTANFQIGRSPCATADAFAGQIKDVRLWSRARSAEEIINWMQSVPSPSTPDLTAQWRLETGTGSTAFDSAGSASPHDGTLINGATWAVVEVLGDCDRDSLLDSCETDSDSDGRPDDCDGCPMDSSKVTPGACGCGTPETDSDGDGTPNCLDGCPNDPNKIVGGTCGCGTPDVDSDGDGTADCHDGCPNDPAKTSLGMCGCGTPDIDSDGDGTPDCLDGCPSDSNKITAGACGCGVADSDTDGDGTPNCLDGCPGDPGKTAAGACGCGVGDIDSDDDGVANCNDGCPNDPHKSSPGACGCGAPDTDSDGDGVADCNDGCPADASKVDPGSCGCGVAETDTDGDGTADCVDGCASDPGKTDPGFCGCGIPEAICTDIRVLSFTTTVNLPGLGNVPNEDIVEFDPLTGHWSRLLDGSDIRLNALAIDAFTRLPSGDILMSFTTDSNVPNLVGGPDGTLVDDADIVRFTPTSVGDLTTGTLSFYFDGSDVGLPAAATSRDIDAIAVDANGDLLISIIGTANIVTPSAQDEDVLRFRPTTLGATTSGVWSYYFNGSNVGLDTTSDEDVVGFDLLSNGDIAFSTLGAFQTSDAAGTGMDIVWFSPTQLGNQTIGATRVLQRLPLPPSARLGALDLAPNTGSVMASTAAPDQVVPACLADINTDQSVDAQDYFDFIERFLDGSADMDESGATDSGDFFTFIEAFTAGCP